MSRKKMNRVIQIIIVLIIALFALGLLTACTPMPPIVDEKCVTLDEFEFIQIEQEGNLLGSDLQYVLKTKDGDIEVSDKIYEGAMNYEYSEICYTREDTIATSYDYAVRESGLRPEPTVITETVTVTETVIETVTETIFTHNEVTTMPWDSELPTILEVSPNIGWLVYPVTVDPLLPNFQEGDLLIMIAIYEPHTITADKIWEAQILHMRYNMVITKLDLNEVYLTTSYDSVQEYWEYNLAIFTQSEIYELLYPTGGTE